MQKKIILSEAQWNVVFHILNNVSDDTWARAKEAANVQDNVDPAAFATNYRHALSVVINADDIGDGVSFS
jgi:hypothetical protein